MIPQSCALKIQFLLFGHFGGLKATSENLLAAINKITLMILFFLVTACKQFFSTTVVRFDLKEKINLLLYYSGWHLLIDNAYEM
mgnify:CR=1 FL=1